jgi:cytidine deaminase
MSDALIEAARRVMAHSYSPYSKFRVGAALRTSDGSVFVGTNFENVSFGLTICAERVAVGCAISAGHRSFETIAIVTDAKMPISPCGACRQVLAEFGLAVSVLAVSASGEIRTTTLKDLMPESFTPQDLRGHG